MNRNTIIALGIAGLLIMGAGYAGNTKTVSAEWYDEEEAGTCIDYSRKCQAAGGKHNKQVGELVDGYMNMTCDGIASGNAASELARQQGGVACNPEDKNNEIAGCEKNGRVCYCVVANCKIKAGEEDLPLYY